MKGRPELLSALEPWIWDIPYNGDAGPGTVPRSSWGTGANCQLFAYQILACFGFELPDFYSSDLWDDNEWTLAVAVPEPLDLVLFSGSQESYGAHVGVVVGGVAVLHLCAEVGKPAIWDWDEFAERPRYSVVLGYKRPTVRTNSLGPLP